MKQITSFWLLMFFFASTALFAQNAGTNALEQFKMEQVQNPTADVQPGVPTGVNQTNGNHYSKYITSDATRDILYDNGGFVTAEGVGTNGTDYSELQDASLTMGTYGAGCQISAGNSIADDFEVTGNWVINSFTFFAYQTGSGPPSTLNDVRVQVYDGDPSAGGTVIFGDLTTNVMLSTEWTNAWRVLESAPAENRPIMNIVADVSGLVLAQGIYWVEMSIGGTGASGPWAPAVTIVGETTTGNSIQFTTTGWAPLLDVGPQGLPFLIDGIDGDPNTNDIGVMAIIAPVSGNELSNAEAVTFTMKNFGTDAQSNIPYEVTWDGPSGAQTMSETYPGTVASGETVQVEAGTVDLSELGEYSFEICSMLAGDEYADNDCKSKTVSNSSAPFLIYPQSADRWTGTTNGTDITETSLVKGVDTEDGWFVFDVSSLPSGATITSVIFHGYVYETNFPYWSLTPLTLDPLTADAAALKAEIQANGVTGVAYSYNNEGSTFAVGWHDYLLGGTANADMTAALAQGWFAMGMDSRDNSATYYVNFDGWNETNVPYLEVEYTGGNPPTAFSEETFESYTAGDYLMQQAAAQGKTYWSTWSAAPGTAEDPYVTNAVAFEGSNSVVIEGTNDAVLYLNDEGGFTEGVYTIEFNVYIPTGMNGYFNVLQLFDAAASEWGMQAYFDLNGAGLVDAGGAGAGVFTYTYDTWHNVKMEVDLDADFAKMYFNDAMLVSWVWSGGSFGTGTRNELHAMNFYAWDVNGTPGAHFDNISINEGGIPVEVDPVTEFTAAFVADMGVETTWVDPEAGPEGTWIGHDDGVNTGGLGVTDGGTFWGAIRWDAANLTPYDGKYMTDFKFFPVLFATEAEFTFMIWEGADAASLVYEQALSDLTWDEWNTISLDEMHTIDASMDLWIGLEVIHADGENPYGLDAGPAVAGYGDMVTFDGVTWESMSIAYGIDNNFNLQGFVADEVDGVVGDKTPLAMSTISNPNTNLNVAKLEPTTCPSNSNRGDFLGVNIYRDDVRVNTNYVAPGAQAYTDAYFVGGTYTYTAKAVWDEGLSPATPGVEVNIPFTGDPEISVNPTSFTETHPVNNTQTEQTLTITNTGFEQLDWSIAVDLGGTGAQSNVEPIDPELYAQMLAERRASEGFPISLANTSKPTPSPNQTDDDVIRYDDGVNNDAIGLTAGGTFQVAAYWPAATMGQYAGMKLSQVEVYINDLPSSFVLKVYDAGTTTIPGTLLHEETVAVTALSWNVIELSQQVDISGNDIWIGYEITHAVDEFIAGCDIGPAVAGYGDMISLDGTTFEPMSALGLDYNWNIASTLIPGGPQPTNDVGVQTILAPVTGVELGTEAVTFTMKNYGTASQSNIPWTVTWTGAASGTLNGTYTGPLASGATAEINAGNADLSAFGDYSFETCTSLAGDENTANDCKTKAVSNLEPSLCVDLLYSTGCSLGDGLIAWDFADVNVPDIPCAGTPPWYHDYRDMTHNLEAGETYTLTATAGYADTYVDVWIDLNDDLLLTDDELLLNDGSILLASTPTTFEITIPATAADGAHVLRYRTNWNAIVEDPCATYSYGNCCDFTAQVGENPQADWLSVNMDMGSLGVGESTDVTVYFDSQGLANDTYVGALMISSNDPATPMLDVPATLNVGGDGPEISVSPASMSEMHTNPPQVTTQPLTLGNIGTGDLTWDIVLDLGGTDSQIAPVGHLAAPRQFDASQPTADVEEGVSGQAHTNGNDYRKYQGPNGTRSVLFDNGPLVTAEGVGSNGSDYSELQDASLGMGTYGAGFQISAGNSIADDFVVTGDWDITSFTFFGYQTGSGPPSTLNDVRVQIYDGDPSAGGTVIWGDFTTNVMLSTEWTNAWRVLESGPTENRPIMQIVADASGLSLSAGTYWVEFSVGGTGASGPWAPAVTIVGETTTGNCLQYTSTGWAPLIDGGTSTPQGTPFIVEGSAGTPAWLSVDMNSGTIGTGGSEEVTVTFNSTGLDDGTYNGTITINSNDATNPSVDVPVTLTVGNGTTTIIFEPFEDYDANDYLVQQAVNQGKEYWTTWSNTPGTAEDPMVSDAYAYEGDNSVVINGTNDAVLIINEPGFTTGLYDIDFMVLIPTGFNGYFNVLQLFDGTTSEWGMQAYFDVNGAGLVDAGGAGAGVFTYTYDTWHNVHLMVNLDTDYAEMYFNGEMLVSWLWSGGSFGTGTRNELHAMNFYAWDVNGAPGAHFDNIDITGGGATTPVASWNPGDFFFSLNENEQDTQYLDVSNVGTGTLSTSMSITYGAATAPSTTPVQYVNVINPDQLGLANTTTPTPSPNQTDDEVIRYDDGINNDAIGLTAGGTFEVSAYWPSSSMGQYVGMKLSEVEVYINDAPDAFILKIYDAGTPTNPGNVLYEETVSVNPLSWNTIVLSNEVDISGDDLWIGYSITHAVDMFCAGTDIGPAVAGFGDMISLDGNTFEPMSALGLNYNWNIAATLTGEASVEWLSISPLSADIQAGQSTTFNVTADTDDFTGPVDSYYYASIWMATNDPSNPMVEIPVTLEYPVGLNEGDAGKAYIMMFPNPSKDLVNISTNYELNHVVVLNQVGQVVLEKIVSGKSVQLNTSTLQSGIYFVKINSEAGESIQKLIVQ